MNRALLTLSSFTLLSMSLALGSLACSVNTDPVTPSPEEQLADEEAELVGMPAPRQYAGEWLTSNSAVTQGDFLSFSLLTNGSYQGTLSSCSPGAAACRDFAQVESGSYKVVAQKNGVDRIRFKPSTGRARIYTIAFAPSVPVVGAPTVIELTRSGRTQRFEASSADIDAGPPAPPPAAACRKTGCSGEICADQDFASTCEFRPEYACYAQATCARQASGQCGFTPTPALASCLAAN